MSFLHTRSSITTQCDSTTTYTVDNHKMQNYIFYSLNNQTMTTKTIQFTNNQETQARQKITMCYYTGRHSDRISQICRIAIVIWPCLLSHHINQIHPLGLSRRQIRPACAQMSSARLWYSILTPNCCYRLLPSCCYRRCRKDWTLDSLTLNPLTLDPLALHFW